MSEDIDWDRELDGRAVFHETFLQELREPASIAAFRGFAKHLSRLISEGLPHWHGTPADYTAEVLKAVAADLTYLTKHLEFVGDAVDDDLITPRDKRWRRYALRLGKRLEMIVRNIEAELEAGLEAADE